MEENKINIDDLQDVLAKKWSYSRLSCYGHCPMQYKLKYVDKNYPPFGSLATEFGSAIHHAEEAIANYIKDNKPINYNEIKNNFIIECAKIDYKYKDWFVPNKDSNKTYEEQKYYYLNQGIYRLEKLMKDNPNLEIVGAELKIDYLYKDDPIKRFDGSIDRLLHDKTTDTYIVQDVKSWPIMEGKHDSDQKTPVQLGIYALAWAKQQGIDVNKVKCQYDLPLLDRYVDAGIDPEFFQRVYADVDKNFAGIFSKDWHPIVSALCAYCPFSQTNPEAEEPYKSLCPYHSIWDRDLRLPNTAKAPFLAWKGIESHEHTMEIYKGLLKVKKGSE